MADPSTNFVSQFPLRVDDSNIQFEQSQIPDPYKLLGRDYNIHDVEIIAIQRFLGTGGLPKTVTQHILDLEAFTGTVGTGGVGVTGAAISNVERDVSVGGSFWTFNTHSYLEGVLNDLIAKIEGRQAIGGSGNSFKGLPVPIFVDDTAGRDFSALSSRDLNSALASRSTVFGDISVFTPGDASTVAGGDADDLFRVVKVNDAGPGGEPHLALNARTGESPQNRSYYTNKGEGSDGVAFLAGEDGIMVVPGADSRHQVRTADGRVVSEGAIPHSANIHLDSDHSGPLRILAENRNVTSTAPSGEYSSTIRGHNELYVATPFIMQNEAPDLPSPATGAISGEWGTFYKEMFPTVSETGAVFNSENIALTQQLMPAGNWIQIWGPIFNVNNFFNFPIAINIDIDIDIDIVLIVPNRGASDKIDPNAGKIRGGGTTGTRKAGKVEIADCNTGVMIPGGWVDAVTTGTKIPSDHITRPATRTAQRQALTGVAGFAKLLADDPINHLVGVTFKTGRNVADDGLGMEVVGDDLAELKIVAECGPEGFVFDKDRQHMHLKDPNMYDGSRPWKEVLEIDTAQPSGTTYTLVPKFSDNYDVMIDKISIIPAFDSPDTGIAGCVSFRTRVPTPSSTTEITPTVQLPLWGPAVLPREVAHVVESIGHTVQAGDELSCVITCVTTPPAGDVVAPYHVYIDWRPIDWQPVTVLTP